ncbi:MAG: extracellular solute-binding protein [Spirochaetia bacterium]|nr:extracellular solute-binding protein [Spirochaetia bacterium]MCF7946898.1 extracellular solute-binding protein [Spirochaetia bacterium]
MVKKTVIVMAMMIALVSPIFAQGGQEAAEADTVSVMFQGGEPEQAAVKAALERFQEESGITVEALYTPHGGYNQKLSGYINSGDMPDIIQLDAPYLSNYVWSGVVEPIADYISPSVIADMTESNKTQCTYPIDNELYAVSHQDSTIVLYANKAYLERVGARIPESPDDAWSIDEFEQVLSDLASLPEVMWPLDIMNAYGTRTEWGTFGFSPMFQSAGTGLIDRNNWKSEGVMNSKENITFAERLQGWAQNDWFVPASAGDNQFFNSDRAAAMAWCGHWLWPAAEQALGDDLVVLPLPDFGNGTVSPNGSWVWAITSKGKNKEGAAQLLEFILSDMDFYNDLKALNVFPGTKTFLSISDVYKDADKMAVAMEQAAKTAVSRPQHPAYPTITKSFAQAFDDIINGGVNPAKVLSNAAEEIDEDIKDNDGYPPFGE